MSVAIPGIALATFNTVEGSFAHAGVRGEATAGTFKHAFVQALGFPMDTPLMVLCAVPPDTYLACCAAILVPPVRGIDDQPYSPRPLRHSTPSRHIRATGPDAGREARSAKRHSLRTRVNPVTPSYQCMCGASSE